MESYPVSLRAAREADAPALLAIYAPYVEKTAITFECEVPTEEEFRSRIRRTLLRYPWLVAESGHSVLGYACASAFHPRAAYGWCAEVTVYLQENARGRGLGKTLYACLEDILKAQGVLLLYACIAVPTQEDETLTLASRRFHEREGYRLAGEFPQCGFKFGRWYDMVWMEKRLGESAVPPQPLRPFPALAGTFLPRVLEG
ncbi:GNAT family N-acetyltransferase [uncultured Mailhella sp.]|uniref:GNAT family N-acetyltransferase n=1 Tax=uncultured Mailhella sp. TaxID=1981031 RepID=UPI00260A5AE7|nr:GNAT family N-acetyltransferase [uncultured Mailhella sp.]